MKKVFLLILLVALAIVPFTAASLQSSVQEISCRIDFNSGVISSLASSAPNDTSLQSSLTTLQADKTQLQSFSNTSDYMGFVKGQYTSDMQQIRNSVNSWRKSNHGLSIAQRAAVASSYTQLKSTFDQCETQRWKDVAQDRLTSFQSDLSKYQNTTSRFASEGFDVSAMNTLLADANTQIITPLQNAISSASSSQSVISVVQSYCLYDGCKNGTNFHLAAKFDLARFSSIYSSLEANATVLNLSSSTLSQAQQSITDAQSVLTTVGGAAYTSAQEQQLSADLKSISSSLRSLISEVNKASGGAGLK